MREVRKEGYFTHVMKVKIVQWKMRKKKLWLNTKLLWIIIHNSEDSMWYNQKGNTLLKKKLSNYYSINNWSNSRNLS